MGVNVAQNVAEVSLGSERVIGAVLLILLVVPLFTIAYRSEVHGKKSSLEELEFSPESLSGLGGDIGTSDRTKTTRSHETSTTSQVRTRDFFESSKTISSKDDDLREFLLPVPGETGKLAKARGKPHAPASIHELGFLAALCSGHIRNRLRPHCNRQHGPTRFVSRLLSHRRPDFGVDVEHLELDRTLGGWFCFGNSSPQIRHSKDPILHSHVAGHGVFPHVDCSQHTRVPLLSVDLAGLFVWSAIFRLHNYRCRRVWVEVFRHSLQQSWGCLHCGKLYLVGTCWRASL